MTPVQRLDYSRPPLGYLVHDLNDDGWWWRVDEPEDGCTSPYETEAETVAAAWAHYKAHNDPPGLSTHRDHDAWLVQVLDHAAEHVGPGVAPGHMQARRYNTADGAREAAWAWYDRRHVLALRMALGDFEAERPLLADPWLCCLTWSDDQVSEVERWLVDSTAEMPEELRG